MLGAVVQFSESLECQLLELRLGRQIRCVHRNKEMVVLVGVQPEASPLRIEIVITGQCSGSGAHRRLTSDRPKFLSESDRHSGAPRRRKFTGSDLRPQKWIGPTQNSTD